MKRGIKKRSYEKLSDSDIQNVIGLLESGKPFTKKEACQRLNISYNTIRLNNIIAEYKDKLAFREKRKSQNKGKAATSYEIVETIVLYLNQEPISLIASSLYRSSSFIRGILNRVGVPDVPTKEGKRKCGFLPEAMISTVFGRDEIVWSAKNHGLAKVLNEITLKEQEKPGYGSLKIDYEKRDGSKLYNIYVLEKGDYSNSFFPNVQCGGFYSCGHAYDLGRLDHLIEHGVDISRLEK